MNPFRALMQWLNRKSVTPGQLIPSWRRGQPQYPLWDGKKAIKEGLKLSTVVYACNKLRSECLASLPWYVEELKGDYEWERVNGHPIETLLEYPNEYQSRQTVFQTIGLQLDLVGNALMTKIMVTDLRSGGQVPSELWVIDPTNVQPIPDAQRFISGYQYIDGERRIIDAAGVIHFQFPDPSWPYWGLSPLQAAAGAVNTSVEAFRWNMNSLQNRAMPEGLFSFKQPLGQEDWERARDWIAQAYASPDNARTPMVLGSDAAFTVVNWKPLEMDFVNSMNMYDAHVCMVYGVPPTMIGLMEKATDSNVENYEASFWRNSMIPFADMVKATLIRGLIPREDRGKLRICYDLSGVKALAPDLDGKTTQYATLVGSAVSPNAARKYLSMDLEDEVGGDDAYIAATLVPLKDASSIANEPTVTAQPRLGSGKAEELAEEIKTLLVEQKDERLALPPAPPLVPMLAPPVPDVYIYNGEPPKKPRVKRVDFVPVRGSEGEIIRHEAYPIFEEEE